MLRLPITLVESGRLAQLQPGDQLPASAVEGLEALTLVAGPALAAGQPLACAGSAQGLLARADDADLALVVGFAGAGAAPDEAVPVRVSGALTLPDWSAVAGTVDLTPAADYFLAPAAGRITATVPTVGHLVRVGRAVTGRTLVIRIGDPIRLG